jgi:S-adenosylmethionine hydrolase
MSFQRQDQAVPLFRRPLTNKFLNFHPTLRTYVPVLLVAFFFISLLHAQTATPPTVVFMTDFGVIDDSVALCKGVMYGIEPNLRIVDLTHQVTPFSILDGARFLYGSTPYFPAGTVFVVVIDPGVGSTRKAVVAKSKRGQYFVLPDNGLMTLVADRDGIEGVREITNRSWMIGAALSSTFHGRDIFSPVGAHLAHGQNWTDVGPELKELVRLDIKLPKVDAQGLSGDVIAIDGPFGNLVTNINADDFSKLNYSRGDSVPVSLGSEHITVPFVRTFSDVAVGKPLLYIDSRGHIALAVNQASFAATYHVKPPVSLFIPAKAK